MDETLHVHVHENHGNCDVRFNHAHLSCEIRDVMNALIYDYLYERYGFEIDDFNVLIFKFYAYFSALLRFFVVAGDVWD